MNLIEWYRATAEWMVKDRSDIYATVEAATSDLYKWVDYLRDNDTTLSIETAGFIVTRNIEEGLEEITLSKKISTFMFDYNDEDCQAWSWVNRDDTVSVAPNLPALEDFELNDDLGLDNDTDL